LNGAFNVDFFWCPDEGGGSRTMDGLAYPGSNYVDWVGSDRYNHANTAFSRCVGSGWRRFWEIFKHPPAECGGSITNYHGRFAVANDKPFFRR
jgi:hypothetical protein